MDILVEAVSMTVAPRGFVLVVQITERLLAMDGDRWILVVSFVCGLVVAYLIY